MGVAIPPIIQAIDAEQVHTYHAGTYGKRWVQGGIAASAVVAEERRAAGGGVEFGPAGDVRFVTELARRVRKGKGGKAGGRDFNGHRSETGRLELSQ